MLIVVSLSTRLARQQAKDARPIRRLIPRFRCSPAAQSECWMGPDLICSCRWVYEILGAQFQFSPLLISHKDHAREHESQQLLHTLGKTRVAFLVTVTQIAVKYRQDLARLMKIVLVNRCYKRIKNDTVVFLFYTAIKICVSHTTIPQLQAQVWAWQQPGSRGLGIW